jgi:hypothetical protein
MWEDMKQVKKDVIPVISLFFGMECGVLVVMID